MGHLKTLCYYIINHLTSRMGVIRLSYTSGLFILTHSYNANMDLNLNITYIISSIVTQFYQKTEHLFVFYSVGHSYTEQKKLRKSQKTMQHKNNKANNYSIFIYLFRYMSSVEKRISFKLLAPMPLL